MLLEILLALFLGILAGILTGLIPGIHNNLIGAFLVSLYATILGHIPPIYLIIFITAMAISNTFLEFIPSIFLGCPDTDTELSILPGHRLLKKGLGYQAITFTAYGGIIAIFLTLILAWPSIFIMKNIFDELKLVTPYLLIAVLIFLIYLEDKKIKAIFVILITGFLGIIILNFEMKEPLLPLLTGLFGSSMLIASIKDKFQIPKQTLECEKIKFKDIKRPLLGSLVSSPMCGFLPGLGNGQAAIIGSTISKDDEKSFLILLGATNVFVMAFSFLALYAISKSRTGAAVAINEIIGALSSKMIFLILIVILISGIISFILTKKIGKFFSKNISKINYSKLSIIILCLLVVIITAISGWKGLIVLIISTITGIYCISLGVKRTNMMGCLLIPTILFYFGL
ncbi:MAG: tripartite tricarboxylate transporter permease [Candidatus Pacearchaeota archaeon]|jgi:putative membrane protein